MAQHQVWGKCPLSWVRKSRLMAQHLVWGSSSLSWVWMLWLMAQHPVTDCASSQLLSPSWCLVVVWSRALRGTVLWTYPEQWEATPLSLDWSARSLSLIEAEELLWHLKAPCCLMGAGTRVEFTLVEGDAMKAIVAGYRLEVFLFFFFEHLQETHATLFYIPIFSCDGTCGSGFALVNYSWNSPTPIQWFILSCFRLSF